MSITLMADNEYAAEYLANGSIKVEGFDVETVWPEGGSASVYAKLFTEPPYDVMVVPITNFLIAVDLGRPLVGIPVFPDVSFAHTGAQVNTNAGITTPRTSKASASAFAGGASTLGHGCEARWRMSTASTLRGCIGWRRSPTH